MPIVPEALTRIFFRSSDTSRETPDTIRKSSRVGPLIAYDTLGEPVWSPRDYSAFAREGFMQNAIVYRCVRMISEAAASIPLLLYEGDNEIERHPLLDLLRQPSLDHTGADFLESWYGFLLVAGNAYVEAVAVNGEIRELHNLRPDRMKVIPGLDGWPEGYEYSAGGKSVRFLADVVDGVRPIFHTRLFHPANDHYGMSPIEAAATAIDIHNTASGWNKALLDNSARPSGALVYAAANGQMTDAQFARLKAELETNFQGAAHAGRPLLLEGGLDWKPLSLSPKDMDFIQAKNAAAREIALSIGVPPQLLGIPGDNTYSNYAEAQRAFWRQTVLPLVNRMAQGFTRWLGPAFPHAPSGRLPAGESEGAIKLVPDLDQVEALSGERDALWARLNAATFLTDDEKRAAAGYGEKGSSSVAVAKFNSHHDEAGRFTTADGAVAPGSGRDDRVRVAQAGGGGAKIPRGQYTVNLAEEETLGGHTIRHHVAKNDAELMAIVERSVVVTPAHTYFKKAQGTYSSVESANNFTNRVLADNASRIEAVASGARKDDWLDMRFGYPTGKEAFRPGPGMSPYIRPTYSAGVYIVHDPTSAKGYRVHTSYPHNAYPEK